MAPARRSRPGLKSFRIALEEGAEQAAVDGNRRAGDVRAAVGAEERHEVTDLARGAQAAQRDGGEVGSVGPSG